MHTQSWLIGGYEEHKNFTRGRYLRLPYSPAEGEIKAARDRALADAGACEVCAGRCCRESAVLSTLAAAYLLPAPSIRPAPRPPSKPPAGTCNAFQHRTGTPP